MTDAHIERPPQPIQSPLPARRRATTGTGFLFAAFVSGCIAAGVAAIVLLSSLTAIAVVAGGTQVLVSVVIIRSAERRLSLTCLFVVAWLALYTLRLTQISIGPNPLTDHPAVVNATRSEVAAVWTISTLGLLGFAGGVALARRLVPRAQLQEVGMSGLGLGLLFYVFLGISYILAVVRLGSGLVVNVSQLYLFGIAFAAHRSASRRRPYGLELVVVVLASVLAILLGAKELAVLPVVAWWVGHFSVRRRLLTWGSVGVGLLGLLFYIGVQSQRDAVALGERSDFIGATVDGLTEYDYPTGLRRHKTGLDIPLNAIAAVTSRVRGADSLFVLRARIPVPIPLQRGRTLWQPAISVVPGMSKLLALEFDQLSLGRYFNQTFWTLRPGVDQSAQAQTVVGDFYQNFGSTGVAAGLVIVGFAYALIDRRTPVCSATSAGLFAYAAIPLLSIDRNFAYLLVTGVIRYSAGLLLIAVLRDAILRVPAGHARHRGTARPIG